MTTWIAPAKDVNLANSIGTVVGVGKIGWAFVLIHFALCVYVVFKTRGHQRRQRTALTVA